MACGFGADAAARGARRGRRAAGLAIRYVEEPEPLGTAGPAAPGRRQGLLDERFLVAQRRRAHRPRPRRADPGARGARGGGHPGALTRSRTRAPTAWCGARAARRRRAPARQRRRRGARVPREAGPGRDRHRRGQRRRLRARAQRARARSRRAGWSRSSARSSRGWSARGCTVTGWRATGWTSAPPSATCRRAGTSSRAASRPRSARASTATGCWSRTAREVDAGASVSPPALVEAEARSGPARRSAPRAVIGRGSEIGERATVSELGGAQRLPDRPGGERPRGDPGARRRGRRGRADRAPAP